MAFVEITTEVFTDLFHSVSGTKTSFQQTGPKTLLFRSQRKENSIFVITEEE